MKLTEKQEKDIIEIFGNPKISTKIKLHVLRFIMNNDIEILLAQISGRERGLKQNANTTFK